MISDKYLDVVVVRRKGKAIDVRRADRGWSEFGFKKWVWTLLKDC